MHRPAVLLVTHDVDEAIVLADRVIVLDDGVVRHDVAHRAATAAARRPTRRFAALRARLLAALGVEDDHDAAPGTEHRERTRHEQAAS